jgi:DNA polymerase IV
MHKNDGTVCTGNPNARTVEILNEMAKYYERMHDNWRTVAYRKAISALKKHHVRITTKEEALKLNGIGERLAAKIEEIAFTNRLRRLESTMDDPADKIMQRFMQIYGVGHRQASTWFNAGFKTIDDLRARAKLTDNQRIGIEHLDDFNRRIPRDEVSEHHIIVQRTAREVDPTLEAIVMGSYRRGAASSGDIDIMITKKNGTVAAIHDAFVRRLLPRLFEIKYLKVGLATTSQHDVNGSKWHGASVLPDSPVWRRIDFLLVPWEEVGAALIYFTGNDIFNRSIRLLASKKGMRLNQHGLYKNVMRGKNRVKITEGELVESRSEKKIFEILGVPWRPPHHRIA